MKKSLVARGITGAVASLLGVMAVGCSAETGAPEAEIGSTSEALTAAYAAMYPAFLKIDANTILLAGGQDTTNPSAVSTVKKYASSGAGSSQTLSSITGASLFPENTTNQTLALHTARSEAEIVEIPGHAGIYGVFGGRDTNGSPLADVELIDLSGATPKRVVVSTSMSQARVNMKVTPCGSDLLISGGDNSGAKNVLEVFHYVSTSNGAASTITKLQNTHSPSTQDVTLTSARKFHEVIPVSSTKLLFVGGESGSPISSTEELNLVNSSTCQLNDTSATTLPAGTHSLPEARSEFALVPVSISSGGVTYDFMLAGGTKTGSDVPTDTILYSTASDQFANGATSPDLAAGQARPALAIASTSSFELAGGINPNTGAALTVRNVFATGSFSNSALTKAREGAFATRIDSTFYVGMGHNATNGFLSDVE